MQVIFRVFTSVADPVTVPIQTIFVPYLNRIYPPVTTIYLGNILFSPFPFLTKTTSPKPKLDNRHIHTHVMSSFQSTAAVRACARRAASTTSAAATLTSTTCRAASRIQLQGQRSSAGLAPKSWRRFASSSIANDNQQKVCVLLEEEWYKLVRVLFE